MLKKICTISLLSLLMTTAANAQDATIGGRLFEIIKDSWNPIFLLIVVVMGVLGIYFIARGLVKCVEAAQNNGRSSYGNAIAYLFAGAMLVALPDVAGIGMTSLLGNARGGGTLHSAELDYNDEGMNGSFLSAIAGSYGSVGTPENCLSHQAPATCMAGNLARNAIPMGVMALFAIVFLIGLASFAMAITDIAKSTERGDQGRGKWTKLITAILLMNSPFFYTVVTSTLLGDLNSPVGLNGLNSDSPLLKYPINSSLEVVNNFSVLIGHAFVILTFFGAWAFVRGIFMIKGVAEGRGNGSYGMAMTYIVAGILLANSKFSACLILGTFGGAELSAGFC